MNSNTGLVEDIRGVRIPSIASRNGEKIQKQAERLFQQIHSRTAPLAWYENWVLPVAGFAAVSSSVSGAVFAKTFMKNVLEISNDGANWAVVPPSILPGSMLSFNSNLRVWNRVSRFIGRLSIEDIKENWTSIFPLLVTGASAIVAAKIQMDAFKNVLSPSLSYTIAVGSGLSALGTNGLFAMQQIQNMRGYKDKPTIQLLQAIKKNLDQFSKKDPAGYIHYLSKGLLKNLTTTNNPEPEKQVNDILKAYIERLQTSRLSIDDQSSAGCCCTGSCVCKYSKKLLVSTPGLIASVMNIRAGLTIPELWGAVTLAGALSIGTGIAFGGSSFLVNAAINMIACANLGNMLYDIYQQGIANYFKTFTWKDWLTLVPKLYLSLGYGIAQGGRAWVYPFPSSSMGYIQAPISALVFTALASMSIRDFLTNVANRWHRQLLDKAIKADDLDNYYDGLDETQKAKLIELLNSFLTVALEVQLDYFNHISNDDLSALLTAETQDQLTQLITISRHGDIEMGVRSNNQDSLVINVDLNDSHQARASDHQTEQQRVVVHHFPVFHDDETKIGEIEEIREQPLAPPNEAATVVHHFPVLHDDETKIGEIEDIREQPLAIPSRVANAQPSFASLAQTLYNPTYFNKSQSSLAPRQGKQNTEAFSL
jgi:hypothetical protein